MRSLVILILISVAVSCSQTEEEVEEVPPRLIEIRQIVDSLTSAYEQNSVQKLNSFLDYWNTITYPYVVENADNDTVKNVYEIYRALYNPFDISEITARGIELNIYPKLDFIVIQNKIFYDFNFDGQSSVIRDSVVDFRPPVSFPQTKNIYLTSEFREALNIFLSSTPLLTSNLNADILNQSAADVEEKIEFLSQSLAILPSHWGDYWHIETQPEITSIHFNENMSQVRINFRFGFIVGEILMVNNTDIWTVQSSSFHIIEGN